MKILWNDKDGGPESNVWCWGLESKRLGSVMLLRFGLGSREAYHTHAFNAVSWLLSGGLFEAMREGMGHNTYWPSIRPIRTLRSTHHRVFGLHSENWVLSFRGPWVDKWREYLPKTDESVVLTHGRKVVDG